MGFFSIEHFILKYVILSYISLGFIIANRLDRNKADYHIGNFQLHLLRYQSSVYKQMMDIRRQVRSNRVHS